MPAMLVRQTDTTVPDMANTRQVRRKEPVRKHFEACAKRLVELSDVEILHRTSRSVAFLETLEALYIREIKPTINTRDEYRSRELTILF